MTGRAVKSFLSAASGTMSSLAMSLTKSAMGWSRPKRPGVGRPHPVLEPGVDLAVEPLAEGRVDEQEEEPGIDQEVEEGFQSGHAAFLFTAALSDAGDRQPAQVAQPDDGFFAGPGVDQVTVRSAQQMQGSMAAKMRGMSAMKPFRSISTVAG